MAFILFCLFFNSCGSVQSTHSWVAGFVLVGTPREKKNGIKIYLVLSLSSPFTRQAIKNNTVSARTSWNISCISLRFENSSWHISPGCKLNKRGNGTGKRKQEFSFAQASCHPVWLCAEHLKFPPFFKRGMKLTRQPGTPATKGNSKSKQWNDDVGSMQVIEFSSKS